MKGRHGEGGVCDKCIYFPAHHFSMEIGFPIVEMGALCSHVCCGMSCQEGVRGGLSPILGAAPDTTAPSKNLPLALKNQKKISNVFVWL